MKKLKVAVIGCGSISVMHLDPIDAIEISELVAVCDIKPERAAAAAEKYGTKAYTSYEEMFEKEELDAVHICLPHHLHVPVAKAAFAHGINVLSEKPMSIDYEDALSAIDAADAAGVKYGVIFQCRYNKPSSTVKGYIENGRLGRVKSATVFLSWSRSDNYYGHSDWKGTWEMEGGGVVIDQVIHSLDLANWFIDSTPVSVTSSLHNRNHEIMVVEDTAEGFVKYENGSNMAFYAMNNYAIDAPIRISLVCENGIAEVSYDYANITFSDGTREFVDNPPPRISSYSGGKDYWGLQHGVQIDQFYRAVLGLEELQISGREALKIQNIVCQIYNNDDNCLKAKRMKK